jgi:phosphatidylserine synthase
MNFFKQFGYSIYAPNKIARFRFQKIGKTIFYLFILALLFSIPSIFHLINGFTLQIQNFKETLGIKDHTNNGLPYLFSLLIIMYYLGSSTFLFVLTTLFASISGAIKFSNQLNLSFKHRFTLVSYCITLPTILSLVIGLLRINIPYLTLLFLLITIVYYYLTIKSISISKTKKV